MNIKTKVSQAVIKFANDNLTNLSTFDRLLYGGTAALSVVIMSSAPCYAAGSVIDNVLGLINTYYVQLLAVALGLAALLGVIAAIAWFAFPTDRGAETGKRWFFRILICIIILLSFGAIISLMKEVTKGMDLKITDLTGKK